MTVIRNTAGFLQGLGVDHDDCQSTTTQGPPATTFSKPWRGTKWEGAKTALFEITTDNPSGVYIRQAVNEVFDSPGEAEYRLARRFYDRYPDLFNSYSKGPQPWVEPRVDLYDGLNLRQQSIQNKTSVRRGDGQQNNVGSEANQPDSDGDPQYAKDRAQSYLDNYLQAHKDKTKQSLLEAMITDIEGNEDLWQIFEHVITGDKRGIPYKTRHNNGGKAGKVREGFEGVLRRATNRHNEAVVLTLTTDPKQHTSLSEALESLSANRGRLLSWLDSKYQLGYRPEYHCQLEFTESGLPHLHLVLFGVSYAVSQEQLSAKWGDYGQGWVVDVRQAQNVHDTDTWRLHDDGTVVALRDYLGKSIRGLQEVANSDGEELRDRLDDGDLSLWRQALYWATERQYYTCSHSLKQSTADSDDGKGSGWTEWEFIGVRQYDEIPGSVRLEATQPFYTVRPPPTNPPPEGSQAV
jgi:hypothetical protein